MCMLAKDLAEKLADDAFASYLAKVTSQNGVAKIVGIDCVKILPALRAMVPSLEEHVQTKEDQQLVRKNWAAQLEACNELVTTLTNLAGQFCRGRRPRIAEMKLLRPRSEMPMKRRRLRPRRRRLENAKLRLMQLSSC